MTSWLVLFRFRVRISDLNGNDVVAMSFAAFQGLGPAVLRLMHPVQFEFKLFITMSGEAG